MIFTLSFATHHAAAISAQPIIKLDKSVYTWTDRVNITVTSPSQNLDPNKIETIGNDTRGTIKISTRGNSIGPYMLVETGPNTGIFAGYVTLTGDYAIKGTIGVDGKGKNPSGAGPSGVGPIDGLLPAEDSDGISVTFENQSKSVSTSAYIRWNTGEVTWLHPTSLGQRVLQIIDADMNLNPDTIDSFLTPVFSNYDLAGIELNMTETGQDTGIFQGIIHFTNFTSSGNR